MDMDIEGDDENFGEMLLPLIEDRRGGVEKQDREPKESDIIRIYFDQCGVTPLLSSSEENSFGRIIQEAREAIGKIVEQELTGAKLPKPAGGSKEGWLLDVMTFLEKWVGEARPPDAERRIAEGAGITPAHLIETWIKIKPLYQRWLHARNKFAEANTRLVVSIVKEYQGQLPLMDLIQAGNIGLLRAADMFNPKKGCRFSTYAVWWIRQYTGRTIRDQRSTIRIPVHVSEHVDRITWAEQRLRGISSKDPEAKDIAREADVEEWYMPLLHKLPQVFSLDAPPPGSDHLLGDSIEKIDIEPEEKFRLKEVKRAVEDALATLTPREETILRMRFGIAPWKQEHTLEEIGVELRVTRERIRQIQAGTLKKLRKLTIYKGEANDTYSLG